MAESTLIMSQGSCLPRAMARSVLPEAVGPIRKMAGGSAGAAPASCLLMISAPPQKQLVQFRQGNHRPGRTAVVTLPAALGGFHVPQQGVHFRNGELPVGPHGTVTG